MTRCTCLWSITQGQKGLEKSRLIVDPECPAWTIHALTDKETAS